MIVIDASAVVDFLIDGGERGTWAAQRLRDGGVTHAPHLLDAEVAAAVRRAFLRGLISRRRGRDALHDLSAMRIERHPSSLFLQRAWSLVDVLTPYDALYVALAEALNCPLVTTDERLRRSHGHQAMVEAPD